MALPATPGTCLWYYANIKHVFYNQLIFVLQSCLDVTKVPLLLCPSLEKLDLERFIHNLPKYQPWLSSESWKAWEDFISKSDELHTIQPDVLWVLPTLQEAGIARRMSSNTQPQPLSEEALTLLQKETSIPKKVP